MTHSRIPAGAGVADQVRLAGYTTLGLGGPAHRFVVADTEASLVAAVRSADGNGEPLLVLGGGSNLVIADEGFPGTVVHVAAGRVRVREQDGGAVVTAGAGEVWDSLVAWTVEQGLAGLECLSGIPGLAGATPIQNVGAYGQEVAETITSVRVFDRQRDVITEMSPEECGFGYRTSVFKMAADGIPDGHNGVTGRFVVLDVTFTLAGLGLSGPVRYRELAGALAVSEGDGAPLPQVRAAVLKLRRAKGMVVDTADPDTRSAGSFFTNPVLDQAQFAALARAVAGRLGDGVAVPSYPAAQGQVKVPAAWLIERAGFGKGYPGNSGRGPRISTKHTLALVNPGGATTDSLLALAREIKNGVRQAFGVDLASEPILVGARL